LPEGEYRVALSVPGSGFFTLKSATFGTTDLLKDPIKVSAAGTEELRVTLEYTGGLIGVLGGVVGGVGPGVPGGVLGAILNPTPAAPTRVPESVLMSNLTSQSPPAYPDAARRAGIAGTVILEVTVDPQGKVTDVRAVSGPAELRQAAIDAVKKWQYRPITVNGVIVPVAGPVSVTFSLR
jgi:TonB family protein